MHPFGTRRRRTYWGHDSRTKGSGRHFRQVSPSRSFVLMARVDHPAFSPTMCKQFLSWDIAPHRPCAGGCRVCEPDPFVRTFAPTGLAPVEAGFENQIRSSAGHRGNQGIGVKGIGVTGHRGNISTFNMRRPGLLLITFAIRLWTRSACVQTPFPIRSSDTSHVLGPRIGSPDRRRERAALAGGSSSS